MNPNPPSNLHLEAQRQDEEFDVVDVHDVVIGKSTRGEVHRCGLLHRAVHIFVRNSREEFLLQRRSLLKDVDPDKFTSGASGHLDVGEAYVDAAVRELREEIGINCCATDLTRVAKIPPSAQTGFEWVELYQIVHDGDLNAAPNEVSVLEWIEVPKLKARIQLAPTDFAEGFLPCFEVFLSWQEHQQVITDS